MKQSIQLEYSDKDSLRKSIMQIDNTNFNITEEDDISREITPAKQAIGI